MTMGAQVPLAATVALAIDEDARLTGICKMCLPYLKQLVHRIRLDLVLRRLQPVASVATRCA